MKAARGRTFFYYEQHGKKYAFAVSKPAPRFAFVQHLPKETPPKSNEKIRRTKDILGIRQAPRPIVKSPAPLNDNKFRLQLADHPALSGLGRQQVCSYAPFSESSS